MAVDREDEVFLEVLRRSITAQQEAGLSAGTELWRKESRALLESAIEAFEELVSREDVEEDEAHEALRVMREARRELDDAFFELLAALDIRLGEERLSTSHDEEALLGLAQFVNRYHGGEFESLRAQGALRQAQRGVELGEEWGAPRAHGARMSQAIARMSQAREQAGAEGAEAVTAYADLVEGRSVAKICYLASRDLFSAALRFEGRHDELDAVMPPLSQIFASFHGRA